MTRSRIIITKHARERLGERFPNICSCEYQQFVSAARYKGLSFSEMLRKSGEKAYEIFNRFHYNNSTKLKYYKDAIFVFSGNHHGCHTLVTVVKLE